MKITVLTPTYNRAHTLPVLYKSLLEQTSNDFEWLVVDDGSVDNTESLILGYIAEGKIDVRYIKQENGGKHRALNRGIAAIDSVLTIIVDSDDYLSDDAIETILKYYEKYEENEMIAGFSFLKAYSSTRSVIGDNYPQEEFEDNYIECRIKKDVKGDKAEVFYTDILKKYNFTEFENEKFLSEDVVWIEMAKSYDMVYINKPIYFCEYLEGGLSKSDKKIKFNSPLGSMYRGKQLMYEKMNVSTRIKGAIIYNCYKKEVKGALPDILKITRLKDKALVSLTKWLGCIYNKKWKKDIN